MTQWRTQTAFFSQSAPIDSSADFFMTGLFIGGDPSGTKLYHSDGNNLIYEYDLTTAYDISTMTSTFTQSFDPTPQYGGGEGTRSMWFTPDGLKMFVLSSRQVYEYNLSTAWSVISATFVQQKNLASQDDNMTSIYFREDGLRMFTLGKGNSGEGADDRVYKFDLTTPYDLSTLTFTSLQGSFHVTENQPNGIFFEDNGLRMYILGSEGVFNETVWEYPLTIAWDITSTLAPSELDVEPQDTSVTGLYFQQTPTKNAGARFWHGSSLNGTIFEYTMAQFGLEQEFVVDASLVRRFIESEVNAIVVNKRETTFKVGARLVFFCDKIQSNTGWITNTGQILVDDVSFPNVIRLQQLTGGAGAIERFTRKDIGRTLDGDVKLEFKFDFIDNSTVFPNISASARIEFQENPTHPVTAGNRIGVSLTRTVETGQILLGSVDDGTSVVTASNGGSLNQHTPHVYKNNGGADSTIKGPYFVTIELKDGRLRTSLFKDSERTQHFRGSPLDVDATGVVPTNLRYIVISNGKGSGDARQLTAEIDEIYVTQNEPLPVIPSKVSPASGRFEEDWETYSIGDQNPTPWFSNTDIDNGQSGLEIREVSDENPDTGTKAFKLHTQFTDTSASTSKGRSSVTRLIDAIPTEDGSGLDVATSLSATLNAIILEGDPSGRSAGVVVQFLHIQGSPSGSAVMAFKLFGNGGLELWTGTSWVTDTSLRINESNTLGTYTGFDFIDLKALFDSDSFISNTLGLDFESHVRGFRIAYAGKSSSVTIGQNTENLINGDFISLVEEGTKQIRPKVNALIQALGQEKEFEVNTILILPAGIAQREFVVSPLIQLTGDVKCVGVGVASGVLHEDDFSTDTGWTNNTPTQIRIAVGDQLVLRMLNLLSKTFGIRRAVKPLDIPFSPSVSFTWEFKHEHQAGGTVNASEMVLELKETSNDSLAGADETTIRYRTDVVATQGREHIRLEVFDKNGINVVTSPESSIVIRDNFTFFPRITRIGDTVKLEMFIDENRTTLADVSLAGGLGAGSPVVQVDITGFDMSQDLGQIYAGNYSTGGPERQANEIFDNIIIENTCLRTDVNAILFIREGVVFSDVHLQDIVALFSEEAPTIQEHEFFVNVIVVIRQTQNGLVASPLIQALGANGACPSQPETISTVLDNIDSFDTQVNTTQTDFKIGQRWTPTTEEVALLENGITKVTLWHGHAGGVGSFDTFVWSNAGVGTSSEIVVRDGGTFNFFFSGSSGIAKRTRTLFDATGSFPETWLPTAGVEYVIGIVENFPGTAQTRKTSTDTINGVFTTRSSAGNWTDTVGQDWSLQFTIQPSGLGQGDQNFCISTDGRLVKLQEQEFKVNAQLTTGFDIPLVASPLIEALGQGQEFIVGKLVEGVNKEEFFVNALLKAQGDNGVCSFGQGTQRFCSRVNAILKALDQEQEFIVDAQLALEVIGTEQEFEVDAVLGLVEPLSILNVESVIGHKTGLNTS